MEKKLREAAYMPRIAQVSSLMPIHFEASCPVQKKAIMRSRWNRNVVWLSCPSTRAAPNFIVTLLIPYGRPRCGRSLLSGSGRIFSEWLYRPFLLVWLLLLTALASSRSRPKGRVIVPLLLTSFAALDAVRHIPIFVLLAIPVIAAALPAASASPAVAPRHPISSRFRPLFIGAVLMLMAVLALVKWVTLARNQDACEAEQFPQKAVAFLRGSGQPRKIFVYYDWGGYAIWKLYPEYRVFVDGRADLYGEDLLHQFETAVQLRTGWRDVLDSWQVEAALLPPPARWRKPSCSTPIGMRHSETPRQSSSSERWSERRPPLKMPAFFRHPQNTQHQRVTKAKKCFPEPSRICETSA